MQMSDEKIINALQAVGALNAQTASLEKLVDKTKSELREDLFRMEASIKQNLNATATKHKEELDKSILHAIALNTEVFKGIIADTFKGHNAENLKPIREDIQSLKSDKHALKWVAATVSCFVTFIGTLIGWYIKK